jgi:hypothetical protein
MRSSRSRARRSCSALNFSTRCAISLRSSLIVRLFVLQLAPSRIVPTVADESASIASGHRDTI